MKLLVHRHFGRAVYQARLYLGDPPKTYLLRNSFHSPVSSRSEGLALCAETLNRIDEAAKPGIAEGATLL